MSKVELIRCDACGLIRGEDMRSDDQWAKVYPPSDEGLPRSMSAFLQQRKDYCLNCWSKISSDFPTLPERPSAPPKKGSSK